MLETFRKNKNPLSIISDPFTKEGLERMAIFIWPSNGSSKLRIDFDLKFKNNKTRGEHTIQCSSFKELSSKLKEIAEFLDL